MTAREQLLTALRGKTPDIVPVTWELVARFAHALTGRRDWKAMVDAHREIGSAVFNLQGVGPHLAGDLPEGYEDRRHGEEQTDGSHLTTRTITTPREQLTARQITNFIPADPLVPKTVDYLVKKREDYDVLEDYIAQAANAVYPNTTQSEEARTYVGDDGLVGFWMGDSVYHAAHSRRDTEYIMDLVEIPARMHRLLEVVDRLKEKEFEAFNASAADVLVYDICWASTSLLNPQMVKEFVLPRARRLAEKISSDKLWGFFTTGRTRDVVPELVDCGPHFIQHFDVLGDCDLAEVKRTFGNRICVMGNYNPVVLAKGSLEDARQEAQRCLDAAMTGGRYVMTSSDEVPADASPDNMKAVVEYVNTHGRY